MTAASCCSAVVAPDDSVVSYLAVSLESSSDYVAVIVPFDLTAEFPDDSWERIQSFDHCCMKTWSTIPIQGSSPLFSTLCYSEYTNKERTVNLPCANGHLQQ